MLRRATSIAALAVLLAIAHANIVAQSDPSLAEVLERLGRYLANYSEQLSRTVAAERYKQTSGSGNTYSEALLESEFGILRVPDYPGWLGFRDVLKVNGRAVQNHESRTLLVLNEPDQRFEIERIGKPSQNDALLFAGVNSRPEMVRNHIGNGDRFFHD